MKLVNYKSTLIVLSTTLLLGLSLTGCSSNEVKSSGNDYDGFYYDRGVHKWRDPDGVICHTCTPENGYPAHGG